MSKYCKFLVSPCALAAIFLSLLQPAPGLAEDAPAVSDTPILGAAKASTVDEPASFIADPLTLFVGERERFMEARDALAAGDTARFVTLYETLDGYPLQEYLTYERLRDLWEKVSPSQRDIDALNGFEQRTGNSVLSKRLTRTLQNRFAETEQWERFVALGNSRLAAKMPCMSLKARWELGQVSGFDEDVVALWVRARKQPSDCAQVLDAVEANNTPPVEAIWTRIYNAMEANKPEFAKPMLGYLASADRAQVKRWMEAGKVPEKFLTSGALDKDTVLNRRIIADLVIDWSREDTVAAMNHWVKVRDKYRFFDDRYYDTSRAIVMRAAYRRMPEAQGWLEAFANREDDLELQEWRIRTALLAEDWDAVTVSISRLPIEEQEEDHWAYWIARSFEQQGRAEEARVIYRDLAKLQSYHGFLSADRLQQGYALYEVPVLPERAILEQLAADEHLIKAREFHFVELQHEGRRVWNSSMTNRSPEELAAAAVLARRWSLHDRAINTAARADQKRALSLRFPVLYRSEVARAAVEYGIEPAWIFGVMRRESAYIRDIKSPAGAIGLMQLMPNTAKYVAKLQGTKSWNGDLTDAQTNIDFGAFYLRHVMDKFDGHQVLATAGYNAGPHRVDQWLQDKPLDADVWIDTIPFTETRRYVRAVLAYAAIYEFHLMGKAQPLENKLWTVPASPEV